MTEAEALKPALWRRALAIFIDLAIYTELVLVHLVLGLLVANLIIFGNAVPLGSEPVDDGIRGQMLMIMAASALPVFLISPIVKRGIRAKLGLPALKW